MLDLPQNVKHVLVAPLNWGLGHASRSIQIIQELLSRDLKVTIASDGDSLLFLSKEFPQLTCLELPSYKVSYNGSGFYTNFIQNTPKILSAIAKEKSMAEKIVRDISADMIISDSRFGFHAKTTCNVIVSHQLQLRGPSKTITQLINLTNKKLLNAFDEIWVPDYPNRKLSGMLSDCSAFENVKYIGPLSSLDNRVDNLTAEKKNNIGIVLSGPEPARTVLEEKLLKELKDYKNVILIRGGHDLPAIKGNQEWEVINLADRKTVNNVLLESKIIISRSGYTSIMDFDKLNIGAILIPTPGQTEQEYLAESLKAENNFVKVKEENIGSIKNVVNSILSRNN